MVQLRSNVEQQGLLQPEEFDLDDLEPAEPIRRNDRSKYVGGERSLSRKTLSSAPPWLRPRYVVMALVTLAALLLVGAAINRSKGFRVTKDPLYLPPSRPPDGPVKQWTKPEEFKIIGLVFFGRPSVIAILDCYLKKHLVSKGGWLDEVHFVVNTDKEDDIRYLDELIKTSKLYKKITIPSLGYNAVWSNAVKRDIMYIKIDDDIVYFNDEAIPDIVYTKLHHPNSLDVVANLINSPETGWLHYHMGAIHSYLPEREPPHNPSAESKGPTAWRASALPEFNGEMEFPVKGIRDGKDDDGSTLAIGSPGGPPYPNHRWLPLPNDEKNLWRTPIAQSTYDPDGPDWGSWSLGAQKHYSFLHNLENENLELYHYGHGIDDEREGVWDMKYGRMNINFMAIWGQDVLDNLPFENGDDELMLSVILNEKLKRPLLVNTHAIAAHFSFRSQHEMYDTDLLDRYRAYANEKVCTEDNQIAIP